MLRIYYCDESGSVEKQPWSLAERVGPDGSDSVSPWYILGSLSVEIAERKRLYDSVLAMKNKYLAPLVPGGLLHERSFEAEVKGKRIRAAMGGTHVETDVWSRLSSARASELLHDLLNEVAFLHGRLRVVAVHRLGLYRKMCRLAWPAPCFALTILQQKACQELATCGSTPSLGVFVIDRGSAIEKDSQVAEFLGVRDQITAATGHACRYDLFLLENPLSARSADMAQLQICDVLLDAVARAIRRADPDDPYLAPMLPFLARTGAGRIKGEGIFFYPEDYTPVPWGGR